MVGLPILFMENLNNRMNIPCKKGMGYFKFPDSTKDTEVFADNCETIIGTYVYYKGLKDKLKKSNTFT